MATTQVYANGDGTTIGFSFSFPYFKTEDIKVELQEINPNGRFISSVVVTDFTVPTNNPTQIQFNTLSASTNYQTVLGAPLAKHAVNQANTIRVKIYRETNDNAVPSTFFSGSAVRAQDLNNNFDQNLYLYQELENEAVKADGGVVTGNITFDQVVTINKVPSEGTDAVNVAYLEQFAGGDTATVNTTRYREIAIQGQTTVTVFPTFAVGNEVVFINGVGLSKFIEYSTPNGSTVVFTTALRAGDVIDVISYNNLLVVSGDASFDAPPFSRNAFIATAGQTVFVCTEEYTIGKEQVFLNGVLLKRNVDYTAINKINVTLTVVASAGDLVEVHSVNYIQSGVPETAADVKYTYPGGVEQTVQTRLEQYVSVKDFGAVGDGVTDDTAAIQAALNSLSDNDTLLFAAGTYKIVSTGADPTLIIPFKKNLTLTGGSFILTGSQDLPDDDSFVQQGIFTTADIAVGTSMDNLTLRDMQAEGQINDGSGVVSDCYLILSRRPGGSRYALGRCDGFQMHNCKTENIKLCSVFGDNVIITNNSAVSNVRSNSTPPRNAAILINQFCSPTSDLATTDTELSDVIVSNNSIVGFGGGICNHTYFNSGSSDRRFLSIVCTGNQYRGYTNAEVTANPNLTRGHYGIYNASIRKAVLDANTLQNGWDMVIDFEYCSDVTCSNNYILNGGIKFFWADSSDNLVADNTIVSNDVEYSTLLGMTGTQAGRSNYVVSGNKFECKIPASISSTYQPNVGFGANSNKVHVLNNTFFDVGLYIPETTYHYDTVIDGNVLYVSYDADAGVRSPFYVSCTGDTSIINNQVISVEGTTQTGSTYSLATVISNRVNVSGINEDCRLINFESNRIVGSPWSINLSLSGTAYVNGLYRFVNNEYEGDFIHNQSRSDNVIYLYNNWRQDKAGNYRQYPAYAPKLAGTTPAIYYLPEDIACQRGSMISLYEEATSGSSGGVSEAIVYGYVCTHIGVPQSSLSPTFSKISTIV